MRLKRSVTVKVIVTEEFKNRLKDELSSTLRRVESVSQQLDFQLRRYVPEVAKTDIEQAGRLRREIEGERHRHEEMRSELESRIREVTGLDIGSQYEQGTVEGEVEISVGDNLIEKLTGTEILIKDGIVEEIKES